MRLFNTNGFVPLALAGSLALGFGRPGLSWAAEAAEPAAATNANLEAPEPGTNGESTNLAAKLPEAALEEGLKHLSNRTGHERVSFGHDIEIKAGETVNELTVFGGSAIVRGKVLHDTVVFGGSLEVQGEVGGDAVVFGGGMHLQTNATIKGDAVSFLGGMRVETNATIKGDAVSFGGGVDVADGGSVRGDIVPFGFLGHNNALPRWLRLWFRECVFKLRPLAPSVGWVWVVAGAFFLIYLLVAAALARPVEICVQTIHRRPLTTLLLGILTKMLVPFVCLFLAITGIGVLIIPFLALALFLGAVIGKVALFEYFGLSLRRQFGSAPLEKPLLGFVVGWFLITLLYMVPVVGLITFAMVGFWGLGCVVTTLFSGLRRESPVAPAPPPSGFAPAPPGFAASPTTGAGPGATSEGSWSADPQPGSTVSPLAGVAPAAGEGPRLTMPLPTPVANVPEALAYPKAGFWERLAAAFLDIVLVSILAGLAHAPIPRVIFHLIGGPAFFFIVAVAYFAGMWTWKGTTVGGIVLCLKVARFDSQPLTFPVALVRALAAIFSTLVLFLGFLWIAWDQDKQGWHDKIAGTVVLRLPRGTPLVCL